MFENSYAGKTVLVTGHTGFKGAWLTVWLLRLGARVVGYALKPPTNPSLFESGGLAEQITNIEGDVRNVELVERTVDRYRPDFIFHLAAQPLVRDSYRKPLETFDVNVMGTLSVLEAVRRTSCPCAIVIVSTDKCYENKEWEYGYRETDPLGGHDPYSASKAAMEVAVASYRNAFFHSNGSSRAVRVASARAGNVIGGGDWSSDRIIPDAIHALIQGQPLKIRNPSALRPWQHTLEPLSGYLWLGARIANSSGAELLGGWNFGPLPTENHTVAELADAIQREWGLGAWHESEEVGAPHEAGLLKLSIDKARHYLKWEPVWNFATAVRRTVSWYREFEAQASGQKQSQALCTADITAYERAAREKGLEWSF